MMWEERDLGSILDEATANFEALQKRYLETLCEQTLALLEECQRRVASLALFSSNESRDDLPTSSMRYLSVEYFLGRIQGAFQTRDLAARLRALQQAQSYLRVFIDRLLSYELLDNDTISLCLLDQTSGADEAAAPSRDIRIGRLRGMSTLRRQYETYAQLRLGENEEAEREAMISLVRLRAIEAVNELDSIKKEIKLLEQRDRPERGEKMPRPSSPQPQARAKVIQPFTIVRDRQQLARNVFRPGHSLPTMTIDEYLELERQRGGIVDDSSARNASTTALDEDDEDSLEAKRQRDIQFDRFKDENPRGWGNTYNLS